LFSRFIAYRDKKLSVSLCVFVRRFVAVGQQKAGDVASFLTSPSRMREHLHTHTTQTPLFQGGAWQWGAAEGWRVASS
jgi:hypothetical protein